ncbi:MAG: nucleotidyltransferase domain-containing protein [Defluviitaleaceae bacterium]|nr:nucleotidyltransferase domain-containing protein [Defluviitaleaceae bacterium]
MDAELKKQLAEKNQNLIDMVIQKAKRDFPEDIALIGLTGSFATNDFHEKSDLDLIIVNNTSEGWGIGHCFILEDVGYDIYCTPWDNLEKKAELDCVGVSSLTDLKVLYYAKPEYLERFNALKEKAIEKLSQGINKDSIKRADKHINKAKEEYADMYLSQDLGAVRYASGGLLYHVINGIVSLNNTCFKRGVKRYLEELLSYKYLPQDFECLYASIIDAKSIDTIREASSLMLKAVIALRDRLYEEYAKKPIPTHDNLKGWYEECWCNNRNKMIASVKAKDSSYSFWAAVGAQNYFDEMTERLGTKKHDLMQYFDSDNLDKIRNEFMLIMDDYLREYEKVGLLVKHYHDFESLYKSYMESPL